MKTIPGFLIIMLLVSGCLSKATTEINTNAEIPEGTSCSIKINGIKFSKSLNHASELAKAEVDKVTITSPAKSDYFNEPDGTATYSNAPVLLTKIDNTKPFTFQTQVRPALNNTYDAGALYIYQNTNWWFKFAFEQDERKKNRIVTVRTSETSDDNNHDMVDSTTVFMKISSDTKTIGYYYSVDQESWQLVRLFKNDYPKELWLGLSAQSPLGNGNNVVFENLILTASNVKDFRLGN